MSFVLTRVVLALAWIAAIAAVIAANRLSRDKIERRPLVFWTGSALVLLTVLWFLLGFRGVLYR